MTIIFFAMWGFVVLFGVEGRHSKKQKTESPAVAAPLPLDEEDGSAPLTSTGTVNGR